MNATGPPWCRERGEFASRHTAQGVCGGPPVVRTQPAAPNCGNLAPPSLGAEGEADGKAAARPAAMALLARRRIVCGASGTGKAGGDGNGFWGRGEMGKSAAVSLRDAIEHDEAAALHMKAAVRCRDEGQAQRAVLEVKYAMLERQLAQLEREKAKLQTRTRRSTLATAAASAPEHRAREGVAVEVMYRDGRWHVDVHGEPEASSIHDFRIAAIAVAHENARHARGDLMIRGRDGTPREHVSYRDDPVQQRVLYRRPELGERESRRGSSAPSLFTRSSTYSTVHAGHYAQPCARRRA